MLSMLIPATNAAADLAALMRALVPAAVDGLVREVLIVGGGPPELLAVLREETGAELSVSLHQAATEARSEQLLLLPASIRLKPGWLEALGAHVRGGGGEVLMPGLGGFLNRPFGVLTQRERALTHPDFKRLGRALRGRTLRVA